MASTRRSFLIGLAACPICAQARATESGHWSYEGPNGAGQWGNLDKSFQACAIGSQQSPIDLTGAIKAELQNLVFDWKPQAFKIANNGHTIQANAAPGSALTLDGQTFALKQFHFHTPAEHALNGKRTSMEAHFVHADESGRLAVIGMLMVAGKANPAFTAVMANAPKTEGEKLAASAIDPNLFLPANRQRFRYEGSLTTPPCAETVDWNIFAQQIEVAPTDMDAFKALFAMNARPLQKVNRRFVLRSS
jgi:carbonic anhydrase